MFSDRYSNIYLLMKRETTDSLYWIKLQKNYQADDADSHSGVPRGGSESKPTQLELTVWGREV